MYFKRFNIYSSGTKWCSIIIRAEEQPKGNRKGKEAAGQISEKIQETKRTGNSKSVSISTSSIVKRFLINKT